MLFLSSRGISAVCKKVRDRVCAQKILQELWALPRERSYQGLEDPSQRPRRSWVTLVLDIPTHRWHPPISVQPRENHGECSAAHAHPTVMGSFPGGLNR